MNFENYFEICAGHVKSWVENFAELHPKLISIDLRMQAGYAQRTLGFEKGDQIPLLENLPKGEVEEVWASVVRNIDFAKSKKQAGEELSAWSALMQASRLFGRLEPIEDYEVIPAVADELDSRLKVKAVQLFASLAPSDGWQSYSRACEEIHPVLVDFYEEITKKEMPDLNLIGHFKRWKKDGVFSAAFDGHTAAMIASRRADVKRFR